MTTTTRSVPRQRRSEVSIERLLEAAERVIDRLGPERTTTAAVAAEAGVSVGRVYYWFPDADALIRAVAARVAGRLADRLSAAVRPLGEVPIDAGVRRLVEELTTTAWAHPGVLGLLADGRAPSSAADGGHARGALVAAMSSLVRAHVAGVTAAELHAVATVATDMLVAATTTVVTGAPESAHQLERELVYALVAYLHSRFPPVGDVVWLDDTSLVEPARPTARAAWTGIRLTAH